MNNFSQIFADEKMIIIIIMAVALLLLLILFVSTILDYLKRKKQLSISKTIFSNGEDKSDINNTESQIVESNKSTVEKINAKTSELDNLLLTMELDLKKQQNQEENIDVFEQEQEEAAIISYQELKEAVKNNLIKPYDDEVKKDEDNSIFYDKTNKLEGNNYDNNSINNEFKNSDIISPVYGRIDAEVNYPKISLFEQKKQEKEVDDILKGMNSNSKFNLKTDSIDDFDINDEEEFLEVLKEIRNNLNN